MIRSRLMYGAYPSAPRSLGVGGIGVGGRIISETLAPGHHLLASDALTSPNGKGRLEMQTDGNLVLYGPSGALWNTGKNGGVRAEMQTDGNFVVYNAAGHSVFDTKTSGRPGSRLVFQDDGNLVVYERNTPYWQAHTTGWTPPNPSKGAGTILLDIATAPIHAVAAVTSKIPVVGDLTHIVDEAAAAPGNIATAIASGARLDHVAVNALKDQLRIVKDVAPYAQTVVSLIPGVGSGVAAAVGAGVALAEGQSITEALKSGIRGALPGGPLVQAGFDAALKVAAGGNVAQAVLEGARAQLSPAAQKAFDVGLAVVTGEKIQTALANGLTSLAPAQLQTIVAAGQKAISGAPDLTDALKSMAPGAATQGFQIAAGLLSSTGINEKALAAARNGLSAEVRQGFDAALKTQEKHVAWISNVTNPSGPAPRALEPPVKKTPAEARGPAPQALEPPKRAAAPGAAPQALEPPKKRAAAVYGPYPSRAGAVAGLGWQIGVLGPEDTWGPPITTMPPHMEWAGRSAVHGSHGRPRKVQGPDGTTYLFSIENGTLTARPELVV